MAGFYIYPALTSPHAGQVFTQCPARQPIAPFRVGTYFLFIFFFAEFSLVMPYHILSET